MFTLFKAPQVHAHPTIFTGNRGIYFIAHFLWNSHNVDEFKDPFPIFKVTLSSISSIYYERDICLLHMFIYSVWRIISFQWWRCFYFLCEYSILFFFLSLQYLLDSHLLPSKMLWILETWTYKNADGWAFFEPCTTKSAGGLESQMYSCIFNGQRTELWSLGTSFPENTIVVWSGKQGYHFLNLHCMANAEIKWHTLGVV